MCESVPMRQRNRRFCPFSRTHRQTKRNKRTLFRNCGSTGKEKPRILCRSCNHVDVQGAFSAIAAARTGWGRRQQAVRTRRGRGRQDGDEGCRPPGRDGDGGSRPPGRGRGRRQQGARTVAGTCRLQRPTARPSGRGRGRRQQAARTVAGTCRLQRPTARPSGRGR